MNLKATIPPGNWNPDCKLSFLKWQDRTREYLKERLNQ